MVRGRAESGGGGGGVCVCVWGGGGHSLRGRSDALPREPPVPPLRRSRHERHGRVPRQEHVRDVLAREARAAQGEAAAAAQPRSRLRGGVRAVCTQAVWMDGGVLSDPFFVYPPFTDLKRRVLKLVMG